MGGEGLAGGGEHLGRYFIGGRIRGQCHHDKARTTTPVGANRLFENGDHTGPTDTTTPGQHGDRAVANHTWMRHSVSVEETRDGIDRRQVPAAIAAAASGDAGAWRDLVETFAPTVWAALTDGRRDRAAAVEAARTTWLHLVDHLDLLPGPGRIDAWLATTARREAERLDRLPPAV